jgi:hypothetical protein
MQSLVVKISNPETVHAIAEAAKRQGTTPQAGAELVRQKDSSLFKPTAEDIFEDVFSDLDHEQAAQVKARAAEEAMRLVAEKKRGETSSTTPT